MYICACRLFFGEQGAPQETQLASGFRQDLKPHQLQVIRYWRLAR